MAVFPLAISLSILSFSKDHSFLIRSASIFTIILSLPKAIRSLFVSARERTVEAKWAASIPNTRPAPVFRPGHWHLHLGSPPASFRVLPGTWEFPNEATLGCAHPIAVPGGVGNWNGSAGIYASIYGRYRHQSLACWEREILPL